MPRQVVRHGVLTRAALTRLTGLSTTTITMLVTVLSGALAAYAIARVLVDQRAKAMFVFLLVSMFPRIIISPLFRAFVELNCSIRTRRWWSRTPP